MKKYIVEFKMTDGTIVEMEFITDRIDWTIEQYCRNRSVANLLLICYGSIAQ